MKRKIYILSIFLIPLFISTSCIFMGSTIKGNGNVVEETRKVGDFDEISVSRGMNVYISQGEKINVVVKADENLLDVIETRVDGDVLKVTTSQSIRRAKAKKVYITVPEVVAIKSSSGSNIFSETEIESGQLEISASSGSNIKLDLDTGNLTASASSGSNIKLDGQTESFTGKASSGANVKAGKLTAEKCNVKASSGANLWVKAHEKLDAHASSGGNIFYSGKPGRTNIEKSSGGNVIKN